MIDYKEDERIQAMEWLNEISDKIDNLGFIYCSEFTELAQIVLSTKSAIEVIKEHNMIGVPK